MRSSAKPIERPVVAVFSSRALAACIAETLHHGDAETGGLFLGHRCGPMWYVIEVVDPGPRAIHHTASFQYDEDYLNHLTNKLRWYYAKPMHLLGLWHRHPGSLDRFSLPDRETNQRFLALYPEGVFSAIVNIDPRMRLTLYFVGEYRDQVLPAAGGDGLIPPALMAFRASRPSGSYAGLLSAALRAQHAPGLLYAPKAQHGLGAAQRPGLHQELGAAHRQSDGLSAQQGAGPSAGQHASDIERLLAMTESDVAFLSPLCDTLSLRVSADGGLELVEAGLPLLRFYGGVPSGKHMGTGDGENGAAVAVGTERFPYRTGLVKDAVLAYTISRAGKGIWPDAAANQSL